MGLSHENKNTGRREEKKKKYVHVMHVVRTRYEHVWCGFQRFQLCGDFFKRKFLM